MTQGELKVVTEKVPGGDAVVVRLTGPIDLGNVTVFRDAARSQTAPVIVLDLAAVPYVDSAGLGALIGARVHHQQGGRRLLLAMVNPQVRALLEMTKVETYFEIFEVVEDALQTAR